ncbi:MAG TPA: DUF456 domain-containing protein [Gemmatimonadales bacterium]|jgi:uncharacterized protein|nr:DUF456 domain-containing protein [Gemmatimonadales bacterium]
MSDVLAVLVLAACGIVGLLMIPFGLPGLWVMVLGFLVFGWLTQFRSESVATIGIVLAIAFAGELVETWLGFRFARRYGGSRRAGWGALLGGLVGAVVGVPVPVVGSLIGAFVGSFGGAAVFEYAYSRRADIAVGAGWGAVVGRAAAAAAKIALGLVIGVISLVAALR